ncbi:MAG: signal recognition particle-docking protein FtsY [Clostridia bacterium]|nr:signal recognition particle-docking protein FtsY [Clostridia bacterium]
MGFFEKIKQGLKKTKDGIFGQIDGLLKNFVKIDEDLLEELEEILILADVGLETTDKIMDGLRERIRDGRLKEPSEVKQALKDITCEIMDEDVEPMTLDTKPSIILVVGVNGVGKTTTIAKLAHMYKESGKKVILAAADTFRAAAADQLEIWANRADVDIVRQHEGADPASVVFDTIAAGKSRGADIIICDTAGRLHNKKNLMDELAKINRVIDRELEGCDKQVLLVCDATTGQNGLIQAIEFQKATQINGVVLTKLDGTAKGGIIVAIKNELHVPVRFVGVGEKMDDLQEFNSNDFVNALFE